MSRDQVIGVVILLVSETLKLLREAVERLS
jgi:hypothetical protein